MADEKKPAAEEPEKANPEAAEGEEAAEEKPKKKIPVMAIAIVVLVLVGIALAGGIAYFVASKLVANSHNEPEGGARYHDPGVFVKLGDPKEGILHHPEGVDLIPASIDLSGMEVSLVNAMSRESVLKQYLEPMKKEYDFIILDCMPSLGMLTINALAASDQLIVPVQAQYLSAKGLEQLLQTVNKVKRQINPKLRILRVWDIEIRMRWSIRWQMCFGRKWILATNCRGVLRVWDIEIRMRWSIRWQMCFGRKWILATNCRGVVPAVLRVTVILRKVQLQMNLKAPLGRVATNCREPFIRPSFIMRKVWICFREILNWPDWRFRW